jgi:hypothetical protein
MEFLFELNFSTGRIDKVRVEKTTDKSVWVERGFKYVRRSPWFDHYTGFYRTFHEAQKAGKDRLQKEIDALNEQLGKKITRLTALTNTEEQYIGEPQVFEKLDISKIKV